MEVGDRVEEALDLTEQIERDALGDPEVAHQLLAQYPNSAVLTSADEVNESEDLEIVGLRSQAAAHHEARVAPM